MITPLLIFLWLLRQTKAVLFWVYLWQLKEYHAGRFLDHFRTEKGRRLVVNNALYAKITVLFAFWAYTASAVSGFGLFNLGDIFPNPPLALFFGTAGVLLVLYSLESGKGIIDYAKNSLKVPVFTKKTLVLVASGVLIQFLFVLVFQQQANAVSNLFAGQGDWLISLTFFFNGLIIFDILTPLIVSAIVLSLQPLAVVGKGAMIQKAKQKREKLKKLTVVGITGSYGKTSTKELLAHILAEKFWVLKTPEHRNSEVGISQTILHDLTDEHQVFVCEMGAYGKGGIKLLADIAKPDIGIVTGANEQHLATFGSMENLLAAEGGKELIESLPKGGIAIFNYDSEKIKNQKSKIKSYNSKLKKTIWCSAKEKADIWAQDVKVEKERISFTALSKQREKASFKVSLLGAHNVENILLAAAAARELGMSLKETAKALETATPDVGAMQLKRSPEGLNIVDSTYSANPDGVIAALEYLNVWGGRKAIIMPCLIELGKASKEIHKRIGKKIGEACDLAIITTKECFRDLQEGAVGKGMKKENMLCTEDVQEIFERVRTFNGEEDVILLESRVPKQLIDVLAGGRYEF